MTAVLNRFGAHTALLQVIHCIPKIGQRYVRRDARRTDSGCHNETDFPAFEFLVELQCVENFLAWKVFWQTSRQLKSLQKLDHCIVFPAQESGFFSRNGTRGDNSQTEGFAVQKSLVISRALNGMTNGVPEVENGTCASAIILILCDDFRFYLDVALDQSLQSKRSPRRAWLPRLKLREHCRVGDDRVFNDLSESLAKLPTRQRFQNIDIIDHERWLVHCADQVLSISGVHSSLSAN